MKPTDDPTIAGLAIFTALFCLVMLIFMFIEYTGAIQ